MKGIERMARYVAPDGGRPFLVLGSDIVTIKVSGEETGGEFAAVECAVPPQSGPPPHVHSSEDKTFYVLEGNFEFLAGEETVEAGPGSMVYGPKGTPHTYKNVGEEAGRLLLFINPAGFEEFFEEMGEPAAQAAQGPPDLERFMLLAKKYGFEILLPPEA